MLRKKTRKKVFKLAGSFTTQEAETPKEEYKLTKETLLLIKNGGNINDSCCKHTGRASHQIHRF
jgi:hypothetical protein